MRILPGTSMVSLPRPDAGVEPPTTATASAVDGRLADAFVETLAYARERDYRGWDYGDGMSSRLLRALPFESVYLNLVVQEVVKRAPRNVRPLLLVEQRRNYKGTALFAMANLAAQRLGEAAPGLFDGRAADVDHRGEARDLLEWLLDNRSVGYSGFCGGHNHELQHPDGHKGVPNDPDVVSTSYAVKALLRGAPLDERYPSAARSAVPFLVHDLDYRPAEPGARINYHRNHPPEEFTINAGALGARLLVDLYDHFGEPRLRGLAEELLDHVASLQTAVGGWYYRDPPSSSHLSMDSHHNGFVIEVFQRYAAVTGSGRYDGTLEDALAFYRRRLFEADGAPNFDEESAYPRDIHAATQGILVFTYAGDRRFAGRIADWTLANLYAGDGRFFFRRHRFHDKRVTLMRWCEAWMAYALGEYLTAGVEQV